MELKEEKFWTDNGILSGIEPKRAQTGGDVAGWMSRKAGWTGQGREKSGR